MRKRSKVVPLKKGSISDMFDGCNILDNETPDTDITETLKALSLLEKKTDRGFDEIKESNANSISKHQTELQSVRIEFNKRVEVEAYVTDTVLKNINDKMKDVKQDIQKDVKRELSRELSKNDEVESLRRQTEEVQGTVSNVLNHTESTII